MNKSKITFGAIKLDVKKPETTPEGGNASGKRSQKQIFKFFIFFSFQDLELSAKLLKILKKRTWSQSMSRKSWVSAASVVRQSNLT
jgi:hypothetical protein